MNYVAILVAAVANMVIGFLWYGLLFGKKWAALHGYTEEQIKSMNPGPLYAQSFVAVLVSYYILARFVPSTATLMDGIEVACLVWLGFVTTTQFTASLFSTKPRALYFLDTGYQLVTFIAAGAILTAWK
ncbi:MAG: DUF1761 domain-containing protein [Ignavibacteriales bacterium]|nr:DUF1761 domain-containing protein [Ignavibacteriales bacterium]